jgi:hypothetical protein
MQTSGPDSGQFETAFNPSKSTIYWFQRNSRSPNLLKNKLSINVGCSFKDANNFIIIVFQFLFLWGNI